MFKSKKKISGHVLYHHGSCPFCLKVRLSLWWNRLSLPLKDTLLDPQNKQDLIAGGGKGQVPCLRIEKDNGQIEWMYESDAIINYLKNTFKK